MKIICMALFAASFFPSLGYSQDCAALLQNGIYDIHSGGTDLQTASSYASWFCDKKLSSSQQADNFGASLAFPFHGLPVQLGFNSQSSSWQSWYSNFCASVSTSQSLQSRVRDYLQTVDRGILESFNQCISTQGFHVWLERTYDPKVFKFAARFVPPNINDPTVTIKDFLHGSNVSCTPDPAGRTVDAAEFRSRCTRSNSEAVDLTVNATWPPQGGPALNLPAIPPRPKRETIVQAMERGTTFTLILDSLDEAIGSIPAKSIYTVNYFSSIDTWRARGPHTDGVHTDYPTVDYGYGPGSPGNLAGPYPPSAHKIIIFGHDFDFDDDGVIYDRSKRVGKVVIERQLL